MKSLSIAALAAAILTCAWAPGAGARPVPVNGVLLDSYAAIVNQKVITVGDVFAYMQPLQEQLTAQYAGRELEEQIVALFFQLPAGILRGQLLLQRLHVREDIADRDDLLVHDGGIAVEQNAIHGHGARARAGRPGAGQDGGRQGGDG